MAQSGMEILDSVSYGDIVFSTKTVTFFGEEPIFAQTPEVWNFEESHVKGQFYVNGKAIERISHIGGRAQPGYPPNPTKLELLVGLYSFEQNKHGYVWGHQFRKMYTDAHGDVK